MREVKWLEFVESKKFRSFNRRLMYSGFVPGAFFFFSIRRFFLLPGDRQASYGPQVKAALGPVSGRDTGKFLCLFFVVCLVSGPSCRVCLLVGAFSFCLWRHILGDNRFETLVTSYKMLPEFPILTKSR